VFVVSLPRLYLGLHFPSDIVAGAVVGALVALATVTPLARAIARHALVERALALPHLAYPLMFFVTVQTAFMWEPLRQFLTGVARLAMAVAG
jgi:undecaprenyl-diphosphatase